MNGSFPREAMILAAGYGERLRPITSIYPKPLLPIANEPMIETLIRQLSALGVMKIVINLHHLAELIPAYLGDGERYGVQLVYVTEPHILGTGGGIANMLDHIEGDNFLCLNGDTILLADLQAAWQLHQQQQSPATMILTPARTETNESIITVKRGSTRVNGLLRSTNEVTADDQPYNFTGTHLFRTDFLRHFFSGRKLRCIIREGYVPWFNDGIPVYGYVDDAPLLDTGTVARYLAANRYVMDQLGLKRLVAGDAKVSKSAHLNDYVTIAGGAIVNDNARLSNCILLPGAIVPRETQVTDAVLTNS